VVAWSAACIVGAERIAPSRVEPALLNHPRFGEIKRSALTQNPEHHPISRHDCVIFVDPHTFERVDFLLRHDLSPAVRVRFVCLLFVPHTYILTHALAIVKCILAELPK
jgi:hypothetical protein